MQIPKCKLFFLIITVNKPCKRRGKLYFNSLSLSLSHSGNIEIYQLDSIAYFSTRDAKTKRYHTKEFIGCETGSSTMHCAFIHRRKNRNGWPPMAQAKGRKFKFLAADQALLTDQPFRLLPPSPAAFELAFSSLSLSLSLFF